MTDSKINFYEFEKEFRNYWKDKTPVKGSGYKQVARWLDSQRAYLNPDGSLRSPQLDLENALTFNQQSQSIIGDWTSVGPDQPVYTADEPTHIVPGLGRVTAICFHPSNPNKIYVGTPLGGLWFSENNGNTWQNLNTDNISALGVSAIAIDPINHNKIYIGTGDRDGHDTRGIGIYKSIDGGMTWNPLPLDNCSEHYVSKIIINQGYPAKILVASSRGIFKTTDAGANWTKQLPENIKDMAMRPGSSDTVYCVNGASCYKSADFGTTWAHKKWTGAHRIALCVTPSKIILFCTKDSHFFKMLQADNYNSPFTEINTSGTGNDGQGGYNLDFIIDPLNENIMYYGMVNLYKSVNGGQTWVNQEPVTADDQHIFEFNPLTHRLFIGNDSGIWFTDDGSNYIYSSNGLRVGSSYRIDVAANNPNHIITGNQDASTFVTNGGYWYQSIGGDGITCKFDPTDENYVFGSSQNGYVARSINGGTMYADFKSVAANGSHNITEEAIFQTPFMISYSDPSTMFYGTHDVWRSRNVKTANPANIGFIKISNNLVGTDALQKIEFIEQSRANPDILYVSFENGRMFRSDNVLAISPTWVELPNPINNGWAGIRFESHPSDENIVYMVKGQRAYKSMDKGGNWINLTPSFPLLGIMSIAYMNGSDEGLYIGTTAGVYYKDASMSNWQVFKSSLPLTQVRDLVINYSTTPAQLFAGTFGRGIWKTTVLPSYLLDLQANSGSATVSGTNVSAVCGLQNMNTMAGAPTLNAGFYLSANNIIAGGDHLIIQNVHTDISPGLIFQSQLPITDVALVQPEIPVGTYYLGMLADNTYSINETNENNNSWVSATQVTIPANPAAPTNVQASDGTYTDKTTITWQNNSGQTLYFAVFRKPFWSLVYTQLSPSTWTTDTTFDDMTGESGETYYYYIKASRYPTGNRASDYSTGDAGFKKISPPVNVQATDGQYGDKVIITWPACTGASHYRVYRNTSNLVADNMFISGTTWIGDTSFIDLTAVLGTTYYYWVRASKSELGYYASSYSSANTGWVGFITAPNVSASDGTYTDKVDISWNTVVGASHFRLYRNTINDPASSVAISTWQTALTYPDITAVTGTIYYYWVKASQDASGTVATGLGGGDNGFRNFLPPTNVEADGGTSTVFTHISWQASAGAAKYQVYRGLNSTFSSAIPISNWQTFLTFKDYSGTPGFLYYYWVKAAGDTLLTISSESAYNTGFRKISAPQVDATTGLFTNKVVITWQAATGATYYQIRRSTIENPTLTTTIRGYVKTSLLSFEDITAVQGQYYNYYVIGAVNSFGGNAGDAGQAVGFADACGNMIDDTAYRSIYFHGTTLTITQRIVNEGPFPLVNPGKIRLALENATPDGTPEAFIGYVDIPPLASNGFFDINYTVNLDTITGFAFTYGIWHLACYTSWDNNNCDNNVDDDYIIWENPFFEYSDALHGIYSIGNAGSDFSSPLAALDALKTRGVSDHVFFNIAPGTYNEKLEFTAIEGAGINSRIVFRTDPASTDTAEIKGIPTPIQNYTLSFENCSYLDFIDLKLSTAGSSDFESTYGRVINIGPGCNQIRFMFNRFEGFSDISHTSENNSVIYCNNITSSNILIEGNEIEYGIFGIKMTGANLNSGPIYNLQILNNTISRFIQYGISLEFLDNVAITGNTIQQLSGADNYLAGIDVTSVKNGCNISGNKISLGSSNETIHGLSIENVGMNDTQSCLISNNFISIEQGTNFAYGFQGLNFNHTNILHNSINIYGTAGASSFCALLDCSALPAIFNNMFSNNIISNLQGGYCMFYNPNAVAYGLLAACDYNNMFTSGPTTARFGEDDYGSLSSWSNDTGFDVHSFSTLPGFVSNTDLHINNSTLDGAALITTEVSIDIDEEPRSLTNPDIGADEFSYVPLTKTLTLTSVFLEGLYNGNGSLRQAMNGATPYWPAGIADQISIELHSASNYATIVHTAANVPLSTAGEAILSVPSSFSGSYYMTIKHRNSIATTTALPVVFTSSAIEYSFNLPTKAYGGNLRQMPSGQYVMYGGDVNQDGEVNQNDLDAIHNSATTFISGYMPEDANGDGMVDSMDLIISDNNAARFTTSLTP